MEFNPGNFHILVVDDEEDVLEFLSYNLKNEGYHVRTANNGREALRLSGKFKPHLIVLDVMMPEMDGIETCQEMRQIPDLKDTFIIFLTARNEDYSQIAGFEAGADDYVTKPVKPKVLLLRIKAILSRLSKAQLLNADVSTKLRVDREKYLIFEGDKEYILPRKEFEIIDLLMSKPEKVFSRDEIFHLVWGDSVIVGDRNIDVHIRRLRDKFGDDVVKTIKGVGYKFGM